MFILRTYNFFLLSFSAISSFKGKCVCLTPLQQIVGETGNSIVLKWQSNTALISEGRFHNFQF